MPTDTERLDFLQNLTKGYGDGWVLRLSRTGRGWRLHESSHEMATPDIRDAIDRIMAFHKDYDMLLGEES